ncbi:GGDEF domain-containing protein [Xanthobacter sp. V2C-8]|uniref:GGDEF domain-containing protein n=1 Tax=Xanthobacter albus TaxID=3119929 RepID=UPI00372B42A3
MPAGGLYLYTGPIVAFFLSALYLGIWLHRRERAYILLLSLAFFCFMVAALSQMLFIPRDSGLNAVVSTAVYTLCIYLLVKGIGLRFGGPGRERLTAALSVAVVGLSIYFFYVEPSLLARIYVQNFGYGIIVVAAALRVRARAERSVLDRAFFWVLLLFGLHFFVRTVLTAPIAGELARYDQLIAAGADPVQMRRGFADSAFWQVLNFSVFIAGLLIALMLFLAVALDLIEDFRRESGVDTLTGLLNRRGFLLEAGPVWADAEMRPLSVAYGDLDHFKAINDSFGHAAGDRVLRQFAELLSSELRHRDVAARFGGEEFVLLLPRAEGAKALAIADRVRRAVRDMVIEDLSDGRAVTVSFGVAEVGPTETLAEAIHRADRMLYAAKRAGRDRSLLAPEVPHP